MNAGELKQQIDIATGGDDRKTVSIRGTACVDTTCDSCKCAGEEQAEVETTGVKGVESNHPNEVEIHFI